MMKKPQKYCNEEMTFPCEDGYDWAVLKCRELKDHQLPHKTKVDKENYIYWTQGTI